MVDQLLIGRKLAQVDSYLGQMREFSKISLTAYKNDWKTQRIVERTLQILIEVCVDIANHIISDQGMRLPTGYADTFEVLQEVKVISKRLGVTMAKMAKFRNIVVHQYEKIDPVIVVSILRKNLIDFEKYKKAIINYLSR
ncbi:MAG: DUF86 domain-containing protein [Proteobacteria bacterium]|nr:DUF86 domain-containing protein [Pseudomonadota bacterium]